MSHERHLASRRPLVFASAIVGVYFGVELAGALISGSLALLADAAHTISDVAALGLALVAAWWARRPHTAARSFGYMRAEIMAALLNGFILIAIAALIFTEAIRRFQAPPEVDGGLVSLVASGGLAANVLAAIVLVRGAKQSLNTKGALFHVLGDAMGSVGVIIAGLLVWSMGWVYADPAVSLFIGVVLVAGALRLMAEASHILLEGTPAHLNMAEIQHAIERLPRVLEVHDLHIWTITSGYEAMSAHIRTQDECSRAEERMVLDDVRRLAAERYHIAHVTVQLEHDEFGCEEEAHLPQQAGRA